MTEMRDVVIRTASVDDIEALANIYVSSARHHTAIDPDLYVVPEAQRVVKHLRDTLDLEHAESVRLVAAVGGRVGGSARVELCSTSPVSMLRPVLAGSVDVAVHGGSGAPASGSRMEAAEGVGARARREPDDARCVRRQSRSAFYEQLHGYRRRGVLMTKHIDPDG